MDLKYSNACKEVLVLFNYFLDENDMSKIPDEQIKYLNENANQQYNYVVDESKELEEQEITKEAKAIIISLYKKYFATDEQKKKVNEILVIRDNSQNTSKQFFNSLEEINKYQNSIKEKAETKLSDSIENSDKALVKSEESIWKRILNKILKRFLGRSD